MTRELNLDLVEESYSRFDEKFEVEIPVEIKGNIEYAKLTVDRYFSTAKTYNCVRELLNRADAVNKMKMAGNMEDILEIYFMFMSIKYFTSFPAPEKLDEQLKVINMMLETGLLFRIFAELDTQEVKKLLIEVNRVTQILEENIDEIIAMKDELDKKES